MNNKFYIYFHINPLKNEVFYVGKGCGDRAYDTKRNKFWCNTVNKYGEPKVVIVRDNISEKYAFLLEKAYIKIFGRRDLNEGTLVNLTDGGDGISGYKHTDKAIQKISESNIGNTYRTGILNSEETRKKISKSLKGHKQSVETKNKISNTKKDNTYISKEHKKKISESLKGNKNCLGLNRSEETKEKISNTLKGNIISEEIKSKISKGMLGKNLGKNLSEETKKKISKAKKGKKWIYNIVLKQTKLIYLDEYGQYLELGWKLGRISWKK